MPKAASTDLRAVLAGVRAFILDADGVLMFKGAPDRRARPRRSSSCGGGGCPYRVVTNFSSAHRSSLAAAFGKATGQDVDGAEIITAASAAAAHTAREHPGKPILVIAAPDARREWEGQEVLSPDEADARAEPVAAVVIGDAGDDLSFRNMDIAFRQLRAGAAFVAMHRNPWWMTPRGFTLDAGAVVAGLEFALGRKALISGKPSPLVFREAFEALRTELAADPRHDGMGLLRFPEVVMVGDDPATDLAPARRLRMRGILVLTGKTTGDEAAAAGVPRAEIAASLAEVVANL